MSTCQIEGLDQAILAEILVGFADVDGNGAVRQAPRLVRVVQLPCVPLNLYASKACAAVRHGHGDTSMVVAMLIVQQFRHCLSSATPGRQYKLQDSVTTFKAPALPCYRAKPWLPVSRMPAGRAEPLPRSSST